MSAMFQKAKQDIGAEHGADIRSLRRDFNVAFLTILSDGQAAHGECPFCEVPIGNMDAHYSRCPYGQIVELLHANDSQLR